MSGKIPSQMTYTELANGAVVQDTLGVLGASGVTVAQGGDLVDVVILTTAATGAAATVDPGSSIANLTLLGSATKGDLLVPAASGKVSKYIGTGAVTITVANATDIWSAVAHGLVTGQAVRLTNSGGALPAGTDSTTTYYVGKIDADTFYLYDTQAHAIAGGATGKVNATGDGTGTQTLRLFGAVTIVGNVRETGVDGQKVMTLFKPRYVILP